MKGGRGLAQCVVHLFARVEGLDAGACEGRDDISGVGKSIGGFGVCLNCELLLRFNIGGNAKVQRDCGASYDWASQTRSNGE